MVIEYEKYKGVVIYLKQIYSSEFEFKIMETDGKIINFQTDIKNIRLLDCPANIYLLEKIKKGKI